MIDAAVALLAIGIDEPAIVELGSLRRPANAFQVDALVERSLVALGLDRAGEADAWLAAAALLAEPFLAGSMSAADLASRWHDRIGHERATDFLPVDVAELADQLEMSGSGGGRSLSEAEGAIRDAAELMTRLSA
ncbi:hypothetical protein [Homoserinibacter sp. YIM 151385]|uniref:hypothetical protein n=1 Tax=Homoserinibacter sp. YIM 151385 TaxID=2985506 RepID=UPI0022F06F94|nr:hypothetical protein [Homoserinibacter sp. YIM 151385]WBU38731.1 hypothetical protein OF852_03880 [Homoserinibacter sp. YIM 151385]